MKSLLSKGALSARWRVTARISVTIFNPVIFAIPITLLALLFYSCNENTNGQSTELKQTQAGSLQNQRVDIKVNRRYDELGDMIGFDSTYSSYYSNMSGDTARMDSLIDAGSPGFPGCTDHWC